MKRIGVVLAGGMIKGAYEIGCLQAIEEHFGKDAVSCISASSIGAVIGYAFSGGKMNQLSELWHEIDINEAGRFFPSFSRNPNLITKVRALVGDDDKLTSELYITLWNLSSMSCEYTPLHGKKPQTTRDHLTAAIALPMLTKGVRLNKNLYYDGAFIDNIPVYPLLNKELDYIFCIYFDNRDYYFENDMFNDKIIKIYDFPANSIWVFDPGKIDSMIACGYNTTKDKIERIFESDNNSIIHRAIRDEYSNRSVKRRITADVLLTNINKMTARLSRKNIL